MSETKTLKEHLRNYVSRALWSQKNAIEGKTLAWKSKHSLWKDLFGDVKAVEDGFVTLAMRRDEDPPLAKMLLTELKARVIEAINALKPETRQIVILHYHEGLSYPQIAEILLLSEGTIKGRVYRAYKHLRMKLRDLKSA